MQHAQGHTELSLRKWSGQEELEPLFLTNNYYIIES